MITRERAVALVEALLDRTLRADPHYPDVAVLDVTEHLLGWLVTHQSLDYLRTGDVLRMLVGSGPYLVDREDGSIHHIPVTTYLHEDWPELYLEQVRGIRPPDPLRNAVRAVLQHDGPTEALRCLRRRAPQLGVREAKAYVDALRAGTEPPEEIVSRLREHPARPPLSITTLAGPVTLQN